MNLFEYNMQKSFGLTFINIILIPLSQNAHIFQTSQNFLRFGKMYVKIANVYKYISIRLSMEYTFIINWEIQLLDTIFYII